MRIGMTAALALLAAGSIAAGCGGDDAGEDGTSSPLTEALSEVGLSGDEPTSFTWVDTARLREVAGLGETAEEAIDDEEWQTAVGLVFGSNGALPEFEFDPMGGERTIVVGSPPVEATRFDGLDPAAAEASFEELGFEAVESEGREFLALGDEGEIASEPLSDAGAGLVGINRVLIEDEAFAFGGYEDAVVAALDPGEPLGDQPGFAAMADCMGEEALAASIRDPRDGEAEQVALVGVGIATAGGDPASDVVCAVGAEGESLDEVSAQMEEAFNEGGLEPVTSRPYEDLLGPAEIESGESDGAPWVRATFDLPTGTPVGVVFQVDQQAALPLGGDPPSTSPTSSP